MAADPQFSLVPLISQYLRQPASWAFDAQQVNQPVFEPPLTVAEQATLADLQLMAKFGIASSLTLAEFQAIKPNLAELRPGSALQTAIAALRTRTDAQWNALTAAQRQADQITWLRDLTDAVADLRNVIAALLRS
jgi:hypothetical protein